MISVTTDVFCDGEDCINWEHGVIGLAAKPAEARRSVKTKGWIRVVSPTLGHLDLCPDCAKRWREGLSAS